MIQLLTRYRHLFLALSSGALAWLSWPGSPFSFLIFFAWIPLLQVADEVNSKFRFLVLCYLSLFVWNLGTTWWIWNATGLGAVAAWLANSGVMCLPWLGYRYFRNKLSPLLGYLLLGTFWMSFEYLHLQDWGLSWPWLTLGNVFAMHPEWIQWYSVTGVAGGTLWIWLVNLLLYQHWKSNALDNFKKTYSWLIAGVVMLAIPIGYSMLNLSRAEKNSTNRELTIKQSPKKEIVIVQPNINPYEKIAEGTTQKQIEKLLQLTRSSINPETALVIWPETALYSPYGYEETLLHTRSELQPIRDLLETYQQLSLFSGIESYRWMKSPTPYSVPNEKGSAFFEAYNGSVLMDKSGPYGYYHKSMLVPGVETLPWFLRFIDNWFKKFGGVTAGYAKQENRSVLVEKNGFKIAPAICYESIYGDFMRRTVKQGAGLIAIITNDGWWKKTPGHIQHVQYARLRAIETGCWVARSANTGISAFINPRGEIIDARGYDTASTLHYSIPTEYPSLTFYVKYGDWLFELMALLAILLTGYACLSSKKLLK